MATRNLRIITANEVHKGINANGGEYTIYEVEAVDAATGVMVNVPLRSFESLVEGETAEFLVEKYERPGKPTSYTLKKPKGKGGGSSLGPKVDQLRERVGLLEENLKIVQANLQNLIWRFEQQAGAVAAAPAPGAAPAGPPPDDDIPF